MEGRKKGFREYVDDAKVWAKNKGYQAQVWYEGHKEVVLVAIPVFGGFLTTLVKAAAKKSAIKSEEHLKEDYVYDNRNGHYYELKRQPKSSEWIEIDRRKQNGELLGEILRDMRILK